MVSGGVSARRVRPFPAALAVFASAISAAAMPAGDAAAQAPNRVVAVAPLHAAGGERSLEALAGSITDVLSSLLAEDPDVTVVERKRLDDVLTEQKLQASVLVDTATAVRLGRLLGADLVVAGSLVPEANAFRLALRVVTVAGNEVRGTVDLPLAKSRVAEDLLALGPRLSTLVDVKITVPTPEQLDDSPLGRMHLLRGISCYTARLPDQAVVHLLRAIRTDPRLIEARIWIARAYLDAGEPEKAKLELARIRSHSAAGRWQTAIDELAAAIAAAEQAAAGGRSQ
jgi:hypothetical protein